MSAPKAIVINAYGGSEVLQLEDITIQTPQEGQISIRQTAIGVNFHDIYVRSGMYDTLTPPGILGCEATGIIEAMGTGVEGASVGDRVAYVTGPPYGAYASHRLIPPRAVVTLPDGISDALVAGNFLRALTVDMLTRQTAQIRPGMTVLVHAAAGGVGRLLCQMASYLGATVIGTVGSPEKAKIATQMGCAHAILYREADFVAEANRLTSGKGVDIVYDSIGADTFQGSLDALAPCGHLVNFGQSSGNVDPLTMATLAAKSLTVSRPILFHYIAERLAYQDMATSVFKLFSDGVLKTAEPQSFPLSQAASAHDLLASKTATAPIILIP